MPSDLVRVVETAGVQEFLGHISPSHFTLNEFEGWIYRGVTSFENHDLRPTALRGQPLWETIGLQSGRTKSTEEEQWGYLLVEEALLTRFYETLDASGLAIPGDQRSIREIFRRSPGGETLVSTARANREWWPHDDIVNLLALAQHYGLPTRLLDWTERALIAAYFSVRDVFKPGFNTAGRLAVWAMDYGRVIVSSNGTPDVKARLRRVTVPAAGNPNLNAQRGLFTVMDMRVPDYDSKFDQLPLDQQLRALISATRIDGNPFQPIVCYTLPRTEAPALAEELLKLGIDANSVFPGFEATLSQRRSECKELSNALRDAGTAWWVKLRNDELIPFEYLAAHEGLPDATTFCIMHEGSDVDIELAHDGRTRRLQVTTTGPLWTREDGSTRDWGYDQHLLMRKLNTEGSVSGWGPFAKEVP